MSHSVTAHLNAYTTRVLENVATPPLIFYFFKFIFSFIFSSSSFPRALSNETGSQAQYLSDRETDPAKNGKGVKKKKKKGKRKEKKREQNSDKRTAASTWCSERIRVGLLLCWSRSLDVSLRRDRAAFVVGRQSDLVNILYQLIKD